MIASVLMPWWAWAYLIFAVLMFAVSFLNEKGRSNGDLFGSLMSLFTICVCVTSLFNAPVYLFFRYMIFPMVAIGIIWELTRASRETELAQQELSNEPALTDGERKALLNVAIGFNALVVVPGYAAGLLLCFRFLAGGALS